MIDLSVDPTRVRIFGDPVLRRVAEKVVDFDDGLARLAGVMKSVMYVESGLGLAAPQIGVRRRLFVYDIGDGVQTIVNPVIEETRGEWVYRESFLSIPGLSWEIIRPKEVYLTGCNLHGRKISIEADTLLGRLFQHELDHLEGVLLIDILKVKIVRKQLR